MPQMRAVMSGASRECAAAQERLEEARRLVDPQLDVGDAAVLDLHEHRALALDAREVVGLDRLRPARSAMDVRASSKASTLNVRNTRTIATSPMPSTCSCRVSETVFGVSFGPKQP